jgi:hypothetical protein
MGQFASDSAAMDGRAIALATDIAFVLAGGCRRDLLFCRACPAQLVSIATRQETGFNAMARRV